MRLILIEGLPGTGKSSLAGDLCDHLNSLGLSGTWHREEAIDHTVIDKPLRQTASQPGYAARCIEAWQRFTPDGEFMVLEGCLFQTTLRFLIEYGHPEEELRAYLHALGAVFNRFESSLIYLHQPNDGADLVNLMADRKGADIVNKIAQYTSQTPYAVTRGLTGYAAIASLYSRYRDHCDLAVDDFDFPVLRLDSTSTDYLQMRAAAIKWLETLG